MKNAKEGKWESFPVCSVCNHKMNKNQKMNSYGVCPYCGHDSESTICDTYNVILKKIWNEPIWKFWAKNRFSFVGRDGRSKKWMNMEEDKNRNAP